MKNELIYLPRMRRYTALLANRPFINCIRAYNTQRYSRDTSTNSDYFWNTGSRFLLPTDLDDFLTWAADNRDYPTVTVIGSPDAEPVA